jgi:hypothetical protein
MLPSFGRRELGLRGLFLTGPPVGSLALRPGDSLTIPKMALSIGFISFVSSTNTIQATGLLILAPVGLTPTEHASLSWTHSSPKIPSAGFQVGPDVENQAAIRDDRGAPTSFPD